MTASVYTHSDRDEIKRRAEADFAALAEEHGARRRGKVLACPFHDDKNPSATIHKGRFHCFGCGLSLDVIAFVQKARGEDFKGALAFLGARYSVALDDKPLSGEKRREYANRREAADREARELIAWRDGLLELLRQRRNVSLAAYHRAVQYIVKHGADALLGELAMDGAEVCEVEVERLQAAINQIKAAPFDRLLVLYRQTIHAEAATPWIA